MKRWAFAATTLIGASACLAPGAAQAQARADFDIAPQPLESALLAFADQAHVSLALPAQSLASAHSPGVRGRFETERALSILLSGAGFTFERAGERAYRILAAPASTHGRRAEANVTDDIIVTAARRNAALRDLPRSVSDISAQRLEQIPARDADALAEQISGLQFTNVGDGRNKIYVRGVSDGALSGRAQSTVGIYLDGVRLTYAAPDPDLQLVDVARVDVLRGPQGALYGAGSIGGLLSIESNAPDASAFYGSVLGALEATRSGGVGGNGELVVNAPIIANRLAVRYAGYSERNAGWIDNPSINRADANETTRRGSRLSAQYDISPHWRARAFTTIQTIDSADSQYLELTPAGPVRTAHLAEPHDNDFLVAGATLHGETRFGELDSTSALVRHEINSRYDATGGFAAFGVDPNQARPMDEHNALDIVVHETRLTSPAGALLPWFAGLFFADGDNNSMRTLRDGAYGTWDAIAYREDRTDAIDELALFGEATWRLADHLTLSTGARAFRFSVKTQSETIEPLHALSEQSVGRLTDSGVAPDIRLAYQPRTDWLFYLAAAEGYRSGGFNSGAPIGAGFSAITQPFQRFAGDELWTYEVGTRLSLFNARFSLSAAAFFNDWRRIQTDQIIADGLPYTGNVGRSRAVGYEADLVWTPTDALTFRSHVLVNEPDIVQHDPGFPVSAAHLPGAPEFLGSASVRYERPIDSAHGDLRGAFELSTLYVGPSATGFINDVQLGGYEQVNASIGLSGPAFDVMIYAWNLLDEAGETFSLGNPYATTTNPLVTELRPTTLGVEIRRRF